MKSLSRQALFGTRAGPAALSVPVVRLAAGLVFVVFGIGKFIRHADEVASFEAYGLPAPEVFVSAIGVLEIAAGLLLVVGLATRLAALVMAGNMVAAIIVSGIGEGEVVPSLTLAPILLAAMLFLLWLGPGALALDGRLLRQRGESSAP